MQTSNSEQKLKNIKNVRRGTKLIDKHAFNKIVPEKDKRKNQIAEKQKK